MGSKHLGKWRILQQSSETSTATEIQEEEGEILREGGNLVMCRSLELVTAPGPSSQMNDAELGAFLL